MFKRLSTAVWVSSPPPIGAGSHRGLSLCFPTLSGSPALSWGNVCLARARRATFLLAIPTSAPDLPSHGEAPQVDHIALHTFPTKHVAKYSKICEFNHSNCHL